jgi:plasmid replication initiation protein
MKSNLPKVLSSKTPKVYKNKNLNNANFSDFNHTDYQVLLHLISKIGGVDLKGKYLQPEQLQREYLLTAKEFSEVFNVSISNCYVILKQAVDKLMKTDIRVERVEKNEFWRINICSKAEYKVHEGCISIKFTDDIMPYLAQVKEKFVLYNLKELSNFGSLYTTRFYELLQEFKETGWMLKSVTQLREAFAIGNKLKAYKDFKQRTFGHACQEINSNYDIGLKFEEIKEGRKIVAVKFFFKKTAVCKRIDQDGNIHITYAPPKLKKKVPKVKKYSPEKVLDGQLSFVDTKDDAKPIKGILSSILSKFTSNKD